MAPPQQLAFPPTALRNVAAGLVVGNPVGSGGTRGKALTAAELKAIVEASGISYLPLSGGTLSGDLTLSSGRQLVGTESKILLSSGAGGQLAGYIATSPVFSISSSGGFRVDNALSIGWANLSSGVDGTPDLRLYRGSAGIFQQRNGLNAQSYELFETYTSSTNFGALRLKATSSGHQIGSARGTSGSNRALQLGHFDSAGTFTSALSVATGGDVDLPLRRITSVGTAGLIIAGDASTGSTPLRIQTGSTVLYDFSYSGTISLVPAVSTINIGSGVMHVTSSTGNRSLVKSYVHLELCPGALGGGGTYVEINNGTAGTYRDLVCRSITASGESKIILPTADPHILGCLWNNSGTITISAG